MKKSFSLLFISLLALFVISCNQSEQQSDSNTESPVLTSTKVKTVMTKQMQDALTPDAALKDLLEGNQRYVSGNMENRDLNAQISATTNGQFPKAVILACIDSRVPVEYIFDQGVGDVFVARVAGNIEDKDLLGSMEYGVAVAGSKVLMVMGHENCGAVKSAIKQVDVGSINVDNLLAQIEPAIQNVEGERNYKDKAYFDHVIKENVSQTIADIRKNSHILSNLEKEGKVKIVGAYYSLTDGKVTLLDEHNHDHGHSHDHDHKH
ncbi:carbonic anhydrase [Lentimicrobium sp. L6]|uniref:carbonic anhydrase family protein n=1 Tax=Lentimicrobium sp. L6 TaxID=2735916 RepID=UPI001555ED89|nr:carbonic anhydrase family protein [Lentimicrobium sp. L6]NPD84837.1 carbonic anhydrase [Lentimicrobium sp. L6]